MATAQEIKALRDRTGAGFMDCKAALEATNGDIDAAIIWLREKGIAKAAKKADRTAAEGQIRIFADHNDAIMIELDCETDFVAKNDVFSNLLEELGPVLLAAKPTDVEAALKLEYQNQPLSKFILAKSGQIGENLVLRRFQLFKKPEQGSFGFYEHAGNQVAAVVIFDHEINETVARDIAMQVTAMQPQFIATSDVPKAFLDQESAIIKEQLADLDRPPAIKEKIITGKLNKRLQEISLLSQPFIKDSKVTVEAYLKPTGAKIISMARFTVGEDND